MEISGKVHCLFEQSGTFKNEFKKLGYEAYDYDIQDNFGETDYKIDIFAEIESAYQGGGKYLGFNVLQRFMYCIFPVYILLCTKSDEFHMGMYKL